MLHLDYYVGIHHEAASKFVGQESFQAKYSANGVSPDAPFPRRPLDRPQCGNLPAVPPVGSAP
jgi:hypothetical protein